MSKETKKLKFVKDAIYRDKVIYKSGDIHDVPVANGFALRWEKRGVAIEADEKSEAKVEAKPKASAEKQVEEKQVVEKPAQQSQNKHKGQNKKNVDQDEEAHESL